MVIVLSYSFITLYNIHICMSICICICAWVCNCVCIYLCICLCICTYTNRWTARCTTPSYPAVIPRPRAMDILMLSTRPPKYAKSLPRKVARKQQLSIGECSYANCRSSHFIVLPHNAASHFPTYLEPLDFWPQFLQLYLRDKRRHSLIWG